MDIPYPDRIGSHGNIVPIPIVVVLMATISPHDSGRQGNVLVRVQIPVSPHLPVLMLPGYLVGLFSFPEKVQRGIY